MRLVPETGPWPRMMVWPLLAVGSLGLWLAHWYPDLLYRLAHCPLRDNLGIPCFTCGGTHGLVCYATGHWPAAFLANPLVFVLALLLTIWSLYALAATFVPAWRRSLQLSPQEKKATRWLVALLLLANWVYEFTRY